MKNFLKLVRYGRRIEAFTNNLPSFNLPLQIGLEDSFVKKVEKEKEKIFIFSTKEDVEKSINNNILGKGKTPQNIKSSLSNPFKGKCVTFEKPWKSEIINPEDASEFPIILFPGLGGGESNNRLYESWHPFRELFSVYPKDILIYSPLMEGEEKPRRFIEGLPYYYDESYINKVESSHFFDTVLKSRFFNNDGKLRDPEMISPVLLAGFSIGYREVKSHLNFLYEEISKSLEKKGELNPKLIQQYFDQIVAMNVASPLNWSGRKLPKEIIDNLVSGGISPNDAEEFYIKNGSCKEEKPYPPVKIKTIHYRSVLDRGTAKPKDDFNNFHCNSELYKSEIFYFIRPDTKEAMYVMGDGLMKGMILNDDNSYKNNLLGHNLDSYLESMYENSKLFRPIESIKQFLAIDKKIDFTNAEYQSGTTIKMFDKNRDSDKDDELAMKKAWHRELSIQTALSFFKNQQQKVNQRKT